MFTKPGSFFLGILTEVASLNEVFNFILKGEAVLGIMSRVVVEVIVYVLISRGWKSFYWRRSLKISFTFNLHQDVCPRSKERSVVGVL